MYRVKIRTWIISCMLIAMVGSLLSGCSKEKLLLDELGEDGSGKLRIMAYDESSFYREYGGFFMMDYPNIEIEIVNMNTMYEQNDDGSVLYDPKKKLIDMIEKEKPDIILTDIEVLGELVDQGKLYNLDPIIQQEQYDLTTILPGLIDNLRAQSKDGLYALAPFYSTRALFYNADLFKQHNIEPPTNQMSWNELLDLGARFGQIASGDNQLFGLVSQGTTASNLLIAIAETNNLQLIDARGEHILIDSPGWRDAFNMLVNAINSKAVQVVKPSSNGMISYSSDNSAFMKGKAAMLVDDLWMINQLRYMGQWDKEITSFDWQMVTVPVDPNLRDESNYVNTYQVYAISSDAANKRAAWEFLKFINGDKMAKISAKTLSYQLPSRITYVKEIVGKNAEALTLLKPKVKSTTLFSTLDEHKIPYDFYQLVLTEVEKAIDELLAGKSSDEVLVPLQEELQKKLNELKKAAVNAEKSENAKKSDESSTVDINS